MVYQTKRQAIRLIKTVLRVLGISMEEAPEVLAETLREYQEYFEMPKEVNHA